MKKFIHSRTLERLKKLKAELQRATLKPEDEEAIHDLRVAIRRFTQCIRTFGQFFDQGRIKQMRRRLRKLMDRCAAVRNCDIALELLQAAGLPDEKLNKDVADQRRDAQKELARGLPSFRSPRRSHLHVNQNGTGAWNLKESPAENARRVLPDLAQELFEAGDRAVGLGHRKLHQFRLQVKQFRYTFELFQPFYDAEAERGMVMLRELQDKIGAISDCGATLNIVKEDRRSTAAIRRLLQAREAEFRTHWANKYGPEIRDWWKTTLGGTDGSVHPKTRGSGAARSRDAGRRQEARRQREA